MIVVREYFIAKPGFASKLATLFKEVTEIAGMKKTRVLTDVTGEFNKVVMETEFESLADLEARLQEYMNNAVLKEKMKGYTDMYLTGGREIYRTWELGRRDSLRVGPGCLVFQKLTRLAKELGSRLAPPTSAPSMSDCSIKPFTLSGFTLPP